MQTQIHFSLTNVLQIKTTIFLAAVFKAFYTNNKLTEHELENIYEETYICH